MYAMKRNFWQADVLSTTLFINILTGIQSTMITVNHFVFNFDFIDSLNSNFMEGRGIFFLNIIPSFHHLIK